MTNLIYMAKPVWTSLLDSIRAKSGRTDMLTAAQAKASIDAIPAIPAHLGHLTLKPETDLRSVEVPIENAKAVLIASDFPWHTPSANTVAGGMIYFTSAGTPFASGSRLLIYTSSGSVNYYASNSSGGQSWRLSNGVATIANTSGWLFAAGVTYDFFWY